MLNYKQQENNITILDWSENETCAWMRYIYIFIILVFIKIFIDITMKYRSYY